MTPAQYLLQVMRNAKNPAELRTQAAIALLDHPDEWGDSDPAADAPFDKLRPGHTSEPPSANLFWTARQIAEHIGLSLRHISERVTNRRDFPAPYRVGSRRFWKSEDVITWFEARREV